MFFDVRKAVFCSFLMRLVRILDGQDVMVLENAVMQLICLAIVFLFFGLSFGWSDCWNGCRR